jgi:hypothetical protein
MIKNKLRLFIASRRGADPAGLGSEILGACGLGGHERAEDLDLNTLGALAKSLEDRLQST